MKWAFPPTLCPNPAKGFSMRLGASDPLSKRACCGTLSPQYRRNDG
ncbi:hypothetical protein HMPREF0262_02987 [Clostridium sp. ATCC 29733]|nr:hypothetical protein HMPREF0262_02987 [Clostridium sp. ATCC 29733]